MSRSINPVPQYTQGGEPLASGKMYFYKSGSNTPKTTYADSAETIANTHPLILDAEGRLPNCFFSGEAKQVLLDANDVQIFSRDPTGLPVNIGSFDAYSATVSYSLHNIVTASDGNFYKSLSNNNIGLSPLTNPSNWQRIDFNEFYSPAVTYAKLDRTTSLVNGLDYISVTDSNTGNEPSADSTGINWELDRPVLDWSIGRTYAIGDQCYSKIGSHRRYVAVIANTGNEPSVDSGTNWLPADGVVDTPTNSTPADTATGVSRQPTLTTSTYSISGSTNLHEYSQFKVYSDSGLTSLVYDSGITTDLESHQIDQLAAATQYWWTATHKGIRTDNSTVSTKTSFTTTINLSESYDNVQFTGTGSALSVVGTVDLTSNSMVFITNATTTDNARICSTSAGVGNGYLLTSNAVTAEATGLTAFNVNGFDVGALAAYNGSGNSIYSFGLKKTTKLFGTAGYSGTGSSKTESHGMDQEVGAIITTQKTGTAGGGQVAWIRGMAATKHFWFAQQSNSLTDATMWNSTLPTSSEISLGTNLSVNGGTGTYEYFTFAHNPAAGMYCGSYTGTGATQSIDVGFPAGTVIWKEDGVSDWGIFDVKLGTSVRIQLDGSAQAVSGGPVSFDSDGWTVSSSVANTNTSTYYFIAIADPDQF